MDTDDRGAFKFNNSARKIISVFTILMVVVLFAPRVIMYFTPKSRVVIIQSTTEKSAQQEFKKTGYASKHASKSFEKTSKYKALKHKTDPNAMSESEWMSLGVSEKQASSIVTFKNRIKGFKKLADVEKLFTLPKQLFELIKDSLIFSTAGKPFEEEQKSWNSKSAETPKIGKSKIELNSATEEELMSISGIGPFFAKGIVKRRTQLGGFVKVDQLKEVWKFDEEKFQAIVPFISLDESKITKININTATAEQLKAMNYISWNVANSIVKMRNQHGNYKIVKDIQKSVLIDDELYFKIKDYLVVE